MWISDQQVISSEKKGGKGLTVLVKLWLLERNLNWSVTDVRASFCQLQILNDPCLDPIKVQEMDNIMMPTWLVSYQ